MNWTTDNQRATLFAILLVIASILAIIAAMQGWGNRFGY